MLAGTLSRLVVTVLLLLVRQLLLLLWQVDNAKAC
jgi:hypothetical protein